MKEYSLQELFNESEGTEFNRIDGGNTIYVVRNNILFAGESSPVLNKRIMESKFIKVQQLVSFMEAITSGKLIKVDVTESNEKYKNGNKVILNNYWNNVYKSIDGILEMLSQGDNHRNEIILEGKWYIKESEVDE